MYVFFCFSILSSMKCFCILTEHVILWIFLMNFFFLNFKKNYINKWINSLWKILFKMMEFSKSFNKMPILTSLLSIVFVMLLQSNIIGLFPVVTNHVSSKMGLEVMMMGGICWFYSVYIFFSKDLNKICCFFMPSNIPLFLSPAMALTETISFFIRPFTLILRILVNISVGHILLSLISSGFNIFSVIFYFFLLPFFIVMCFFEVMVGVVQASIFIFLLKNYYDESLYL